MPIVNDTTENGLARSPDHKPESDSVTRVDQNFSPKKQLTNALIKWQQYTRKNPLAESGVSRGDIAWCYRNLLGREPESEAMVRAHLNAVDFKQLILNFVGSQEFLSRRPTANLGGSGAEPGLPPLLDRLEIEVNATDAELGKCAAKIKAVWEYLGNEKAHFSVLTDEAFLPQNLNASIDAFWASGETEASLAMRTLNQFGSSGLEEKVCVEYGCGVGRMTVHFAKRFKFVHGYDISRNHLDHARARARETGAENIEFHECAHDFRVAIEPCDFFYSIIVLQHNPPPVILALLRIALKALKQGGIALFQVPTYIVGYRFSLSEWIATDHGLDMQMHCVPQDTVLEIISASGCRLLGVREDGWPAAPDRMVSNTFFCQKQ